MCATRAVKLPRGPGVFPFIMTPHLFFRRWKAGNSSTAPGRLLALLALFSSASGSCIAENADSAAGETPGVADVAVHDAEADAPATPEQIAFFEKKIRPVLADKCYKCHSEKSERIRGGLLLDTREGTRRGGDNGPAVVPGNLDESLLIEAVRYANKDFAMPPENTGGKLPAAVIADFEQWVKMGAPDPRSGKAKVVAKYDEKSKDWWSFKSPVKSPAPAVKDASWPRTEIDRFVLAGLESKGLRPVADADPLTLLRRVFFDLIGLPPTPDEVRGFIQEWQAAGTGTDATTRQQKALESVVDRLLASPRFGERWGRHWLDVARYAESTGKDVNITFPHAWRYRDYVIDSFNQNKPFDEFLAEQIAGDLLPAKTDKEKAENLIATGFLAIGTKGLNERNGRQFALDLADEQIDSMSQSILGLTIACARCHDHKFDPIPQREYYAMAGIFLSTDTRYGTLAGPQNGNPTALIPIPAGAKLPTVQTAQSAADRERLEKELEQAKTRRDDLLAEVQKDRRAGRDGNPAVRFVQVQGAIGRVAQLQEKLNAFDENGNPQAFCMGTAEKPSAAEGLRRLGGLFSNGRGGAREAYMQSVKSGRPFQRPTGFETIGDSPLFARGEVDKPGEKVPRGFITALATTSAPAIPKDASGRLELAAWITSPQNPLTARVFVNRAWNWLFGRGIVTTVDNFGNMGALPANQALLDTLAIRFMDDNWSIKDLIKDVVLSRTYQLSSQYDDKNFHADPENALVWRQSKRRLDAECIRDAILTVSGQMEWTPPVGSAIARSGDGAIGGPRFLGVSEASVIADTRNRSVYQAVARNILPDHLDVFDFSDPSFVTGARETTNVPVQALWMLNSSFVKAQSAAAAERLMKAYPTGPNAGTGAMLKERVSYAYWLALGRPPTATELQAAQQFFQKFPSNWQKGDASAPGLKDAEDVKAAWASFCRALFGSADFRFLN